MAIKRAGDNGEPMASKKFRRSKWKKNLVQENFDPAIDSNDNGWDDGGLGEEIKEFHENNSANFEEFLGPETWKMMMLHSNSNSMLDFMDPVNQQLKCGKEKKA